MKLSTIISRSLRLLCPSCGQEKLFRNWFSMHEKCSVCELKYEREPGYFLGSIYINYGLTSLIAAVGYLSIWFAEVMDSKLLLWIVLAFCIIFPILFYRWARSLWLGFDLFFDPPEQLEENSSSQIDSEPKSGGDS